MQLRYAGFPENLRPGGRLVSSCPDRIAVINELLAEHEEKFASALHELEGCAQYLVRGRCVEETITREIVDEIPEATRLPESIRDQPEKTDLGSPDSVGISRFSPFRRIRAARCSRRNGLPSHLGSWLASSATVPARATFRGGLSVAAPG
ncbi:GvpL/GvpF family gas vesicle protein [Rhodococcus pseudokoreensis]|uniref:GvpL/GvpF family gas vesicle protein n=1 Tax=Rhodococcus pseudokoreensis TaxID=2811421 RepID=A0A974ZTI1_9NOCA|nr:GvpL/GvpF family gas vesicle protein [Rhodococcus pseudokoreensis]QSE89875.1 GvpL/GvpF family gas vesicle protein [Rhodococcus pseudokoreensis]